MKKFGNIDNVSDWRLKKLSYILGQINDQKKPNFDDTCFHIISTMSGNMPKHIDKNCD